MIRFAECNDFSQITDLWKECFPANDEFANWYFANQYEAEKTIVYELDGIITAILQRLPFHIKNIGQVTYVYGACTHPSYRSRGIMSELINCSHELDLKFNIKASILIPQEQSLFEYYHRFGYEAVFKIHHHVYEKQDLKLDNIEFRKCGIDDTEKLNNLYESILADTNYVLRDSDYWKKQISMFNELGGAVYCLRHNDNISAYAFVWNDSTVYIQELLGINSEIKQHLCNEIMNYYDTDTIKAASITENSKGNDYGSIKLYNKENCNINAPFVMNLMFD